MFNWLLSRKLDRLGAKANPDAAFVKALEARLVGGGNIKSTLRRWRLVTASCMSMGALFAGTGAYAYSSDSVLPEHPLYGVRQTIETVEEKAALTPQAKNRVQMKRLKRRLKETWLLNERQMHIDRAQVQRFVKQMRKAIETSSVLPEGERANSDAAILQLENAYASLMVESRDRTLDENEKQELDRLIETQTEAVEDKVKQLPSERQERFRAIRERQRKIKQNRRLKLEDVPPVERERLRSLLPERR